MGRFSVRLLVSIVTFCLGTGLHGLIGNKQKSPRSRASASVMVGHLGVSPTSVSRPARDDQDSVKGASRVSQERVIGFPEIGNVRVAAREDFGNSPRLTFTDEKSGREILSTYLGRFDCWSLSGPEAASLNPRLRFKTIAIEGLPNPLVLGIAICPGGSDSAWEAVAVGVVDGRLEQLTFETMSTSDEGGFFFGNLGHGIGVGAAQWDFVWGEDEGHPPPHKYEVKLLKWDGRRFEWYRVFRTARKFDSPNAALKAYSFHFKDIRKSFPEWSDLLTGW